MDEGQHSWKDLGMMAKRGIRRVMHKLGIDANARHDAQQIFSVAERQSAALGASSGVAAFNCANTHVLGHGHQAALELLGGDANALQVAKVIGTAGWSISDGRWSISDGRL